MKENLSVGLIGLGPRGMGLLKENILEMTDVNVAAVCDTYEDRVSQAVQAIEEKSGVRPMATQNYEDILACTEIDAVVISAAWEAHVPVALAAMRAGKYVGMEVGGAYSVEDCWQLVHTSEQTGIPCMMLENCCYGRTELMLLNMERQGFWGELVHCEGGYHHDLRQEVSDGVENRHYRLQNYLRRNCENYPTHELGPIAKILHINRGNRMLSLSSYSSKARGLQEYIRRQKTADSPLQGVQPAQGDVVTTIITCAGGETITLTLDTTLPGAYSRGLCLRGTKGGYQEANNSIFEDGVHNKEEYKWQPYWNNAAEYAEKYEHPLWREYQKGTIKSGHDGIDWLVLRAFFESVKQRTQTPIDVYDTASWMCISTLSEQSICCGGMPVAIPDFTSGRWLVREEEREGKYCLDQVCEDTSVSVFGEQTADACEH